MHEVKIRMKYQCPNISIVVPFYRGNQYIEALLKNIAVNVDNFANHAVHVEVLFVNDSPEETICFDPGLQYPFEVRSISSGENQGIHGARCYGIKNSKGDYIVMLDQDDSLSDKWLWEQWNLLEDKDIVISNVVYCGKRRKEIRYKTVKEMKNACNRWTLCLEGNKIVSPGQALIRKEIIPKQWLKHNMKHNGADDYLLWALLFEKKCRISYNLHSFYFHQYSNESISHRSRLMRKSEKEMAQIIVNGHFVSILRRAIYKRRFLEG